MKAPITQPPSSGEEDASTQEFYASYVPRTMPTDIRWGLCILCVLLIMALCTSYYLQIKRIRAVHETVISIFAGMAVGLILRLSPGTLIQEMLVSCNTDSVR